MSVLAMAWAWEQQGLKAGQKLVLMALADHADADGVCFPGIESLASKCDCTGRKIIYTVRILQELGLVAIERRGGAGSGRKSNLYRLNLQGQSESFSLRGNVKKRAGQCEKTCTAYKEEPSEEPSDSPLNPPVDEFAYLPDWVPPCAWGAYLRSRQAQRASVAAWQIPLLLEKLGQLRSAGNDPGEVIKQSARSGYKDFFPVKDHAAHQRNYPETAREHHARISEIIDRKAREAAAGCLDAAAVGEDEGDLWRGVDTAVCN